MPRLIFVLFLSLFVVLGLGGPLTQVAAGQAPASAPGLIKEQLADGIYLLRAPTAVDVWTATNAVVVINQDDVTVFDSFTLPATARLAIAEIRALTPKPVRTL